MVKRASPLPNEISDFNIGFFQDTMWDKNETKCNK